MAISNLKSSNDNAILSFVAKNTEVNLTKEELFAIGKALADKDNSLYATKLTKAVRKDFSLARQVQENRADITQFLKEWREDGFAKNPEA